MFFQSNIIINDLISFIFMYYFVICACKLKLLSFILKYLKPLQYVLKYLVNGLYKTCTCLSYLKILRNFSLY